MLEEVTNFRKKESKNNNLPLFYTVEGISGKKEIWLPESTLYFILINYIKAIKLKAEKQQTNLDI